MLTVAVSMLLIVLVAIAVLVFAAFIDRGIEPTRGKWFVHLVSRIAWWFDEQFKRLSKRLAKQIRVRREDVGRRS